MENRLAVRGNLKVDNKIRSILARINDIYELKLKIKSEKMEKVKLIIANSTFAIILS